MNEISVERGMENENVKKSGDVHRSFQLKITPVVVFKSSTCHFIHFFSVEKVISGIWDRIWWISYSILSLVQKHKTSKENPRLRIIHEKIKSRPKWKNFYGFFELGFFTTMKISWMNSSSRFHLYLLHRSFLYEIHFRCTFSRSNCNQRRVKNIRRKQIQT